jgi:hypothetical protein
MGEEFFVFEAVELGVSVTTKKNLYLILRHKFKTTYERIYSSVKGGHFPFITDNTSIYINFA